VTDGFHAYTDQIDADRGIGAKTLLDVPMLGYVPKDRSPHTQPLTCSFPKTAFMTQHKFDPYNTNCGNGQNGSAWVTNTAQLADAQAASPSFQGDWVDDLISRYGTAANGGVAFYELGNEPALWNETHHDWHPAPVDYDELWSKSLALASEIKSRDPSASVLGFSEWGWPNYFCSAADDISNGCQSTDTERASHGGTELAAWLLQQFKADADANGGRRLLDYFDLHYYRQDTGGAVGFRATRSLWDPTYTDESWIGDTIRLLPRMRDWVHDNYPGTKLSLSEYDLSIDIDGDPNPAAHVDLDNLIQAEVLGIFAREGLDLATLWPLQGPEHYADAFRLFRNYDGNKSKFGDTYVSSQSADQSKLAVYGAQRSADGALTLVIINKGTTDLTSHVALAGFTPGPSAQVWRFTNTTSGIQRAADQSVAASGFSPTFPARSMTMVVIPPPAAAPVDGGGSGGGSGGGGESNPLPADPLVVPQSSSLPAPVAVTVRCKVPKLTGMTLKQAKTKLRKSHCGLGKVTRKISRKRKGTVIGQTPKPRTLKRKGAKIRVVVSRGQ
jgi:hypothetical protein